jgi:hypothetical protein
VPSALELFIVSLFGKGLTDFFSVLERVSSLGNLKKSVSLEELISFIFDLV